MNNEKDLDLFLEHIEGWKYVLNSMPDLITVLDINHQVIWMNKAMANRLKVSPDSALGCKCYEAVHNTKEPITGCPHEKLIQDGKEHTGEVYEKNLNGYFLVTAAPIKDQSGNILGDVHIARDITERKKVEKKLENSLNDKEMLIKEIHHRVKNNLMIISSLLSIQARYIKDKEIQNIFKESQSRARSMALIHEKLYMNDDNKKIDFGSYIHELINELFRTYADQPGNVFLELEIDSYKLDVNTAIPLGLVINELVSNSLKHAFPDNRTGIIKVEFHRENNEFILTLSDDGIGLPEGFKIENANSMGLILVKNLVEQVDGILELVRKPGTKFTIRFKEPEFR